MCVGGKVVYVLHPGFMGSKYVSVEELARLYGVDVEECMVQPDVRDKEGDAPRGVIHLYPRYEGVYDLGSLVEGGLCV